MTYHQTNGILDLRWDPSDMGMYLFLFCLQLDINEIVNFSYYFLWILRFAAVVANGKIFAIGGGIGPFGETGRTCEVLDVEKSPNQWKNISSMAHARHRCAAAVFNNHIIVSGGNLNGS